MNKDVEYYRFSGNPATATITVVGVPPAGATVTIGGVVFTIGLDVFPVDASVSDRGAYQSVAEAICAAVNSDKTKSNLFDIGVHSNPFRPFYAMYYGNIVRLGASNPGTLGSSLALATSSSASFVLSGAGFTGGGEGAAVGAGDASAANQVTEIAALQSILNRTLDLQASVRVSSTALESSRVIKASSGRLILVTGYNNGPLQYIHLYNSTTVPADGAVPVWFLKANAAANFSFVCPITGVPFTTGISISNSSTLATKTFGGNDCMFTAVYI